MRHRGCLVGVLLLGWLMPEPVWAQAYHIGVERIVLQYDYASEHTFGGWRFEAGWVPLSDVKVVASLGYWPDILPKTQGRRGSGDDQLIELRFFPGGFRKVSFYSILGIGRFRGPEIPGTHNGVAVEAGIGFEVAVIRGLRVNVAGLRREDDGSADYEARIGASWAGGREHDGRPPSRVDAGPMILTGLAGRYRGDGLGYGLELVRPFGPATEAYIGTDMIPVHGVLDSQGFRFEVDTSLLLFSLGARQRMLSLGSSSVRATVAFAASTFQEGNDAGIRPGILVGVSSVHPLGGKVSLLPSVGVLAFDRAEGPSQVFLAMKVSLGFGDRP